MYIYPAHWLYSTQAKQTMVVQLLKHVLHLCEETIALEHHQRTDDYPL